MASPYLLLLRGRYVVIGKAPDGDSMRFIPDSPDALPLLSRADRIRISSDGSLQLRFEGIDASELHYNGEEQRLALSARDALLRQVGFTNVHDSGPSEYTVSASTPSSIDGTVLASGVDPNGRVIAYACDKSVLASRADGAWVAVSNTTIDRSFNGKLLTGGEAYLTIYTSTPMQHRTHLRDRAKGFDGSLPDWIADPSRNENDGVVIGSTETTLASLVKESGSQVTFTADQLDLVFVER